MVFCQTETLHVKMFMLCLRNIVLFYSVSDAGTNSMMIHFLITQ